MSQTPDVTTLQAQLDREVRLRRRIVDIARELGSTLDHDALVCSMIESAVDLLGAEAASVLEVDDETGDLVISFASGGIADRITSMRVPKGQGIAGWVIANRQSAIVERPEDDERFYADIDDTTGFETINMLALPLQTRERMVGVLEIINKFPAFDEEDQAIGEALAALAAIALENANTYGRLARAIVAARMSYRH